MHETVHAAITTCCVQLRKQIVSEQVDDPLSLRQPHMLYTGKAEKRPAQEDDDAVHSRCYARDFRCARNDGGPYKRSASLVAHISFSYFVGAVALGPNAADPESLQPLRSLELYGLNSKQLKTSAKEIVEGCASSGGTHFSIYCLGVTKKDVTQEILAKALEDHVAQVALPVSVSV
jgi:hypothetical protein